MKAKEMTPPKRKPKQDHEKEGSDNYSDIIARVGNRHRVILVRVPSQYVLQKSTNKGWCGFSYHTDVRSLTRKLKSLGLDTSCTDTMVPVRELKL
jgi:hypothetical protein